MRSHIKDLMNNFLFQFNIAKYNSYSKVPSVQLTKNGINIPKVTSNKKNLKRKTVWKYNLIIGNKKIK